MRDSISLDTDRFQLSPEHCVSVPWMIREHPVSGAPAAPVVLDALADPHAIGAIGKPGVIQVIGLAQLDLQWDDIAPAYRRRARDGKDLAALDHCAHRQHLQPVK